MGVKGAVDPHIEYSIQFSIWEAATAAGATLDELVKIERGEYPSWFLARLVAWHQLHGLVAMHREDAARPKTKGK